MCKNGGPVRVCDSGWDRAGPILKRVDTTHHIAFAQLEASAIWRIFHSKGAGWLAIGGVARVRKGTRPLRTAGLDFCRRGVILPARL